MAKDRRAFLADIRSVFWRRVAMVLVVPWVIVAMVGWPLLLTFFEACRNAVEDGADSFKSTFDQPGLRLVALGLSKMWSKEWPNNLSKAHDS